LGTRSATYEIGLADSAGTPTKSGRKEVATDYDTPRTADLEDAPEQSLEALKARRADAAADLGDEVDPFETELDLPGADLSGEELNLRVLPRQADEFTCTSCYLVHHRSQLVDERRMICRDCAA
jgi:hypothetical protein